ncbi:MAG: hypothetical protein ABI120_15635 [Gemmatimonadaceae bacterium]
MHNPSLFERMGEKVLLLLVGPLDRIPALYARGRWRFAATRAVAYATVMTAGLVVLNTVSGGPMFRAPVDVQLLILRLMSYWAVQLVVGAVLSLFIWRMVERIAMLKAKSRSP